MTLYSVHSVRSRRGIRLVRCFEPAGKPLAENIPRKRKSARHSSAESLELIVFILSSPASADLGNRRMSTENLRTKRNAPCKKS
jgi:hypothetical protein